MRTPHALLLTPTSRPVCRSDLRELQTLFQLAQGRPSGQVHAPTLGAQQVAVGIPGGISKLAMGVQLALEAHPHWVAVKIDLRNAHNEIKRSKVLERLCAADSLRDMAPVM